MLQLLEKIQQCASVFIKREKVSPARRIQAGFLPGGAIGLGSGSTGKFSIDDWRISPGRKEGRENQGAQDGAAKAPTLCIKGLLAFEEIDKYPIGK